MDPRFSAFVYLFAGLAIIYLFQTRRKKLAALKIADFPGIDDAGYEELILLLKTAYERMLYMGVGFFPLAYVSYVDGAMISKLVFLILILSLFIANIGPRNKIMRLLDRYDLTIDSLREQGVRL